MTKWTNSEKKLLETKVSSFKLSLDQTQLANIKRLNQLLQKKNIKLKPYFWFADEWFVPDGYTGIALPFTLGSPILKRIEKKFIGHCEGDNPKEFFKLLCHEVAHAIDNAYKLRLKKKRQEIFGLSSTPYPTSYIPNPSSTDYVQFLPDYYAQSHPEEDWAETFATWLTTTNWRDHYRSTKALLKLQYVDSVAKELANQTPIKSTKSTCYCYKDDSRTLRQYLEEKQKQLSPSTQRVFNKEVFKPNQEAPVPMEKFLNTHRAHILLKLAKKTSSNHWVLNRYFESVRHECKINGYKINISSKRAEMELVNYMAKQFPKFIQNKGLEVYM